MATTSTNAHRNIGTQEQHNIIDATTQWPKPTLSSSHLHDILQAKVQEALVLAADCSKASSRSPSTNVYDEHDEPSLDDVHRVQSILHSRYFLAKATAETVLTKRTAQSTSACPSSTPQLYRRPYGTICQAVLPNRGSACLRNRPEHPPYTRYTSLPYLRTPTHSTMRYPTETRPIATHQNRHRSDAPWTLFRPPRFTYRPLSTPPITVEHNK